MKKTMLNACKAKCPGHSTVFLKHVRGSSIRYARSVPVEVAWSPYRHWQRTESFC